MKNYYNSFLFPTDLRGIPRGPRTPAEAAGVGFRPPSPGTSGSDTYIGTSDESSRQTALESGSDTYIATSDESRRTSALDSGSDSYLSSESSSCAESLPKRLRLDDSVGRVSAPPLKEVRDKL